MTNLSELLPSGGGAKEFEAIASGTLPNGQAVIMRSDGKVEAVGPSGGGASLGTAKEFDQGNNYYFASFYDTNTDQTAIFYTDDTTNTYYGTACSAKVSGTTMTVGTPQVFSTATTYYITCAFDERTTGSTGTGIVAYRGTSNYGYCKAAYIASNGTIQFGGSNTFYSSTLNSSCNACWAPDANCFVIGYGAGTSEGRCRVVYPTSLGNITLGGENTFISSNVRGVNVAPGNQDSASSCNVIVVFRDASDSYKRKARIGQTFNTNITFSGTTYTWDSTYGTEPARVASVDYANGKVVVAYTPSDTGANSIGRCLVATVSGNTISFGSPVNFTLNQESYHIWVAPTGTTNEFLITFADGSYSGGPGTAIIGTVSGTTPSYSGIAGGGSGTVYIFSGSAQFTRSTYDSDANAMIISYCDGNRTNDPNEVRPFFVDSSNSANFIGITSQAIANGATGKVNPQGGVATSSTVSSATTFGAAAVFANNGAADTIRSTYDSNSNRIVVAYTDSGNSGKGTASVGTVTGDTISWGPQALFLDAYAGNNSITFDSSNNKIVVAYVDAANQGYAVVGTVDPSNNTITFGSPTQFESGNTQMTSTVFDSSNNKVVIAYQDDADSDKGKAVVGVVNGTAITFPGSIAQFSPGSTSSLGATFDSTNNKVVVFFRNGNDSNHGYGVVGEVSGNNITFGSETEFWGYDCLVERQGPTFDSTNNKVVLGYRDLGNTGYGYAVAGTVSGNAITFGTPQAFNSVTSIEVNSLFDPSANKIVFSYHNNYASGEIDTGSLSGTVFTFDTGAQFSSSGAYYNPLAYDSTAQKVVVAYRDAGSANHGTAKVINLVGATETFTIGSTYYVQNNGTLTTTSNAVTAGKAISTTQLILNGAS